MLQNEMKHVLAITLAMDDDDLPLGDGCSIGVLDRFIEFLPAPVANCYRHRPLGRPVYEIMTVAFRDEE